MRINDWLTSATQKLIDSGIPTARLDALVLLEDALNKDRGWLLANPEALIPKTLLKPLKGRIDRRAEHEPLAYIRGKSEFYGREFFVTHATLQPRPETETIIQKLKTLSIAEVAVMADVGTGSGAIAITAKLELPHLIVHGTEIQPDALIVAHNNRDKLNADVIFHQGNLLEPLMNTDLDIVLANLPYVPDSHTINQAAMQEPGIAIFGGEDGLDLYRKMFEQIHSLKYRPKYVLTESLPFQHEKLTKIAEISGYSLELTDDFIQVFTNN